MEMKRILIVDDDRSNILIIKTVLAGEGYEFAEAEDGEEALNMHRAAPFDMVITDWMMPVMDGVTLTTRLRVERLGTPVIILITSLGIEGAKERAMMCGADIFIQKPLIPQAVKKAVRDGFQRQEQGRLKITLPPGLSATGNPLPFAAVGIAAGTGGPAAIVELLRNLTIDQRAVYLIVQHGPDWMIETFAQNIAGIIPGGITIPTDNMRISPGRVYLAPGDEHMMIDGKNRVFRLDDSPHINFVRPSADVTFTSMAEVFGIKAIGVVLTGMGCDGSEGATRIRSAGGIAIAQDPDEAPVPSMPQSLIEIDPVIKSCRINEIGDKVERRLRELSPIA
ncbi:MAG: chemotaxis response regulator protein-glutamate methylesterase [Ignavibacteriaceae bacterium]|nr:MAG: response regulator [Chlorobiota bacterium]GJQ33000.1 MAG: chemotaxis response regulator protein-glutamate methylesterase [Ignavibacteriaceae bacterium]